MRVETLNSALLFYTSQGDPNLLVRLHLAGGHKFTGKPCGESHGMYTIKPTREDGYGGLIEDTIVVDVADIVAIGIFTVV